MSRSNAPSDIAKDHLGREMTAEQILRQLATMLGWGNCPPWHVLERDLSAKLYRLRELTHSQSEIPRKEPHEEVY